MTEGRNHNVGPMVLGVILIVIGLAFFVGQLLGFRLGQFTWPYAIILPGLAFFAGMVLGGKETGGLAIPGSVITTTGLILLYQNTTNHWESWAYAWALYPFAVGVGLLIFGTWSGLDEPRKAGRALVPLGLSMFLIGLVFFEVILNISGRGGGELVRYAAPAALILLGVAIIFGQWLGRGEAPADEPLPDKGE